MAAGLPPPPHSSYGCRRRTAHEPPPKSVPMDPCPAGVLGASPPRPAGPPDRPRHHTPHACRRTPRPSHTPLPRQPRTRPRAHLRRPARPPHPGQTHPARRLPPRHMAGPATPQRSRYPLRHHRSRPRQPGPVVEPAPGPTPGTAPTSNTAPRPTEARPSPTHSNAGSPSNAPAGTPSTPTNNTSSPTALIRLTTARALGLRSKPYSACCTLTARRGHSACRSRVSGKGSRMWKPLAEAASRHAGSYGPASSRLRLLPSPVTV